MATEIQFTVNGALFKVEAAEAAGKTLNEFIRVHSGFTGTKLSCGQGGCGACTVAVAQRGNGVKSSPSCLLPLSAMHGAAILTAEGLTREDGDGKVLPHPIQERLAKFNGSQCGFCTPGMVMQLFSTLSQQGGGKDLEEKDMEQVINGNICRCTGYRPIIQCAKSFANGTTVKNNFDEKCETGPYDVKLDPQIIYPPEVADLSTGPWLRFSSLKDALRAMDQGATPMAGGTAYGVYTELGVVGTAKTFVDLTGIADPEFFAVQSNGTTIQVGAGVTWTSFAQEIVKCGNLQPLRELATRCGSIAGAQVRNNGTLGGNIAITRSKGFLSDWVPLLAALGAKVRTLVSDGSSTEHELLAFVQDEAPFDGLIHSVSFSVPADDLSFKAYRVAKRSRNAHALVNAGFAAKVVNGEVRDTSVVLGAVDPRPVRLSQLEAALNGISASALEKDFASVIATVLQKMRSGDLGKLTCGFGREQTDHIISGFVVKFIVELFPAATPKEWSSASYSLHDMERISSASQSFPAPMSLGGDLRKPMTKLTAVEQTTGHSKFTDDMPLPEQLLIAAFVCCPEANASFSAIDASPAKELLGDEFYGIFTWEDLRTSGKQVETVRLHGLGDKAPKFKESFQAAEDLLLPKDSPSRFADQPVALLLATGKSLRLVELAAAKMTEALEIKRHGGVQLKDLEHGEEITVEPLVLTKGKKPADPILEAAKKQQGGTRYITGKFVKKSQVQFAIENQTVFCVPEEGGVTLSVACQSCTYVQMMVSSATGLPQSKVRVNNRRVGGAFGAKILRPPAWSALVSQAALKFKRPVRLVPPKEVDMRLVGGRPEMEVTWQAAAEPSSGKLLAVDYHVYWGHGASEDLQKVHAHLMGSAIDMSFDIPSMKLTVHFIKQHLPPRTAVRGPGHFEAMLLADAVMDGVAAELKLHSHLVREANLFRKLGTVGLEGGLVPQGKLEDYSALVLWDLLKTRFAYDKELAAVEQFNRDNAWKKRGLTMCCARYGAFIPPGTPARVDIFKDGSVQVAVGGIEMGQGLHTKVAQVLTTHFSQLLGTCPPLEVISFTAQSTEQNPNAPGTGASITSEQCMYATVNAVDQLAERLKKSAKAAKNRPPEKKSKHATHGAWFDIIDEVFSALFLNVLPIPPNLSAVGVHMTSLADIQYETFGVAASEIELDVLTGESRVLKSHAIFDIGQTANPMVDMGQMEGCFIMGMGHLLNEGMEYDPTTGKCLTDNTWSYKPPIACDIPEVFNCDLVDLEKDRMNNSVSHCFGGLLASLMGCLGVPWKPSKLPRPYKSAKLVGEPPLLLASSVHSAHAAALVAARGEKLPNHTLPIPAKPFVTLPLLAALKPGARP